MADNENKKTDEADVKADKAVTKSDKPKVKKPSLISRFGAWLKSCRAELKKIVWATWKNVVTNTSMVLVAIVVLGAFLGILDFGFSRFINVLSELINVF